MPFFGGSCCLGHVYMHQCGHSVFWQRRGSSGVGEERRGEERGQDGGGGEL
jgi:hypothetical protein